MKSLFSVAIILLSIAGSWYLYVHKEFNPLQALENKIHPPCTTPIAYTIGPIDPRFGLTPVQVLEKTKAAETLWEQAYGQELFVYAPENTHALPINFIYDKRQQTLVLGNAIDSTEASQQTARADIERAQTAYKTNSTIYANAVKKINADSEAYANEVARTNAKGGATPDEYTRLQAEKVVLNRRQAALQVEADALRTQGELLSRMIADFNAKVNDINQIVQDYNEQAGTDFEEGQYVQDATGKRIDIYAYKSRNELLHTIAHELGHALGINHNTNPASMMYPYNKSGVTLSTDDIAALKAVCTSGK